MPAPDFVHFCLYVMAAFVGGSAIGLERQWHNSAAGLRTNLLVAVGAAVFVLAGSMGKEHDSRIAAQIVSGIGFIGGGAILREGLTIRGVNTAATLWCTAAIGVLCGMGLVREAGAAAGVILFSNTVLRPLTYAMRRRAARRINVESHYVCRFSCGTGDERKLRSAAVHFIEEAGLMVRSIQSEEGGAGIAQVTIAMTSPVRKDAVVEKIAGRLNEEAVKSISWELMDHGGDSE